MKQPIIYRAKEQQEQLIVDFEKHICRKVDNKTKAVLRMIMLEENVHLPKDFKRQVKYWRA